MIANATGCSSIWGGSAPSTPYTKNSKGQGPAWANSLFEDNAEYGLGMYLGVKQMRNKLVDIMKTLLEKPINEDAKIVFKEWLDNKEEGAVSRMISEKVLQAINKLETKDAEVQALDHCHERRSLRYEWLAADGPARRGLLVRPGGRLLDRFRSGGGHLSELAHRFQAAAPLQCPRRQRHYPAGIFLQPLP